MCFALQRHAFFFSISTSNHGVLCTFWLGNVLHAKTASTFSASQLPKVVRTWCVLYVLTWKGASRHNGVQFFISDLASWLRTRGFSEPTVRPSWATNHWKNKVNCDFPTFSRTCIFFSDLLTSAFPTVHIVGSFTSKLTSIMRIQSSFKTRCLQVLIQRGTSKMHLLAAWVS